MSSVQILNCSDAERNRMEFSSQHTHLALFLCVLHWCSCGCIKFRENIRVLFGCDLINQPWFIWSLQLDITEEELKRHAWRIWKVIQKILIHFLCWTGANALMLWLLQSKMLYQSQLSISNHRRWDWTHQFIILYVNTFLFFFTVFRLVTIMRNLTAHCSRGVVASFWST